MKMRISLATAIALMLCLCAFAHAEAPTATDDLAVALTDGEVFYTVTVTDADGVPLSGAMVTICDETTCRLETTDEDGKVAFVGAPYAWEIHIPVAPEGYETPEDVYTLNPAGDDLVIVLNRLP